MHRMHLYGTIKEQLVNEFPLRVAFMAYLLPFLFFLVLENGEQENGGPLRLDPAGREGRYSSAA
jgi:hypothetical protein